MTEQTHRITITVESRYQHGTNQVVSVAIDGDGCIDHFIQAFQSALVAAGFAPVTAARFGMGE
jgi:hypothetical protein